MFDQPRHKASNPKGMAKIRGGRFEGQSEGVGYSGLRSHLRALECAPLSGLQAILGDARALQAFPLGPRKIGLSKRSPRSWCALLPIRKLPGVCNDALRAIILTLKLDAQSIDLQDTKPLVSAIDAQSTAVAWSFVRPYDFKNSKAVPNSIPLPNQATGSK